MRALFAAVPFLLAGCTISISLPYEWCSFTDHAWVDARTAVREERLQVTESMGPVTLELDASVEGGEGEWLLLGPDGTTHWRCRATAGVVHQSCSFRSEPGAWTVRREWRGFTGTQRFRVGAVSPAVQLRECLAEWQLYKAAWQCLWVTW